MDLSSLVVIKNLCKQFGIVPRRDRGQNFLIDEDALHDIVVAAELTKEDTVLEIGPGFGVLTTELATHAKKVVAVELDKKLVDALQKKFQGQNNVTIVQDDILQWWEQSNYSITQLLNFKVVANLPYQITSHILRIILESEHKPEIIVVMVQKEVAERIVAKPGEMSLLSVMVQYYAKPEVVRIVPRTSFWPEPEVDSAILRIRPNLMSFLRRQESRTIVDPGFQPTQDFGGQAGPGMTTEGEGEFFRLVKMGFVSKRKQLQNNLAAGLHISKERSQEVLQDAGFNLKVRAQELSVDDWKRLVHSISH